ncbi:MAG: ornithine carbamoyltransferase [Candidatus Thermoplasmatota archaeon]|nr:ornithine carbamoyltransferase [Candidatus Thermoplasmatota archaeon]
MKRDIISVLDMRDDLDEIIDLSIRLKKNRYQSYDSAMNKVLGMIFEKPSTRTRVSFETAIDQLGGHAIYLNPHDMQIGRGETISDTARVLSRFVDAIVYRAFSHANVVELAGNSDIPVINGLDDKEHPVQIVADYMTLLEKRRNLSGRKLAYVGDGNNMANSLILGGAILGVDVSVACPKGFEPDRKIVEEGIKIARETGCKIEVLNDPKAAVPGADAVYTDVWVSMGEESEKEKKEKIFKPFQVNQDLMDAAGDMALFLHCLPAHRGLEVTAQVMDGPRSVVFDQAENRMHTEKAILLTLLS